MVCHRSLNPLSSPLTSPEPSLNLPRTCSEPSLNPLSSPLTSPHLLRVQSPALFQKVRGVGFVPLNLPRTCSEPSLNLP
jgi:hypothetical protein